MTTKYETNNGILMFQFLLGKVQQFNYIYFVVTFMSQFLLGKVQQKKEEAKRKSEGKRSQFLLGKVQQLYLQHFRL